MALQTLTDAKIIDLTVNDVADRYAVGDMLGEGRFSQVFGATRGGKLLNMPRPQVPRSDLLSALAWKKK